MTKIGNGYAVLIVGKDPPHTKFLAYGDEHAPRTFRRYRDALTFKRELATQLHYSTQRVVRVTWRVDVTEPAVQ